MNNSKEKLISDLFDGHWEDITKSYNIGDLYSIIKFKHQHDNLNSNKKYIKFENNFLNLIINDWNNIINYDYSSPNELSIEKNKMLAKLILFTNKENLNFNRMFDFLIKNKDLIDLVYLYRHIIDMYRMSNNINMTNIHEKIKKEINEIDISLLDVIKYNYINNK